jgi:hypothetical protein
MASKGREQGKTRRKDQEPEQGNSEWESVMGKSSGKECEARTSLSSSILSLCRIKEPHTATIISGMAELVSLREECERLGKEREEIETRLRKYDSRQNRGRRFADHPNEDHDNRPNKRQRADLNSSQTPKLLSSIAIVRADPDRSAADGRSTADEAQKPQQEAYMKPVTVQRNKRMFGALMGHLNSAQKTLQLDSELIEKQDHRKVLATQKNSIESQRVAKLHKVVTREQKDKVLFLTHSPLT